VLDLGRRLGDGRVAKRPVGVLAIFGKLDDVHQVAAQLRKFGLDAAGRGLQAALSPQQPSPHAAQNAQRHQQPGEEQAEQNPLRKPEQGVGQHEGQKHAKRDARRQNGGGQERKEPPLLPRCIQPLDHAIGHGRHRRFPL
jgi:hypothetical protein